MSYKKKPVYRCSICEAEGIAKQKFINFDGAWAYVLPEGWIGEDTRFGTCMCDECAEDIYVLRGKRARKQM